MISNFKNELFKSSRLLIFNDLKINYLEDFENFKIKNISKFQFNNSLLLYSDNNLDNQTYIKFSEIKKNNIKINGQSLTLEDYLIDKQIISQIDLICINTEDLQLNFLKFESIVRFTKFIVVDFNSISNIRNFYLL